MSSRRDVARNALGRAAVLSLHRAAELAPIRDSEAAAAMRANGLVHHWNGRAVVVWGDVIDAVKAGLFSDDPAPHDHCTVDLPRVKLDPIH